MRRLAKCLGGKPLGGEGLHALGRDGIAAGDRLGGFAGAVGIVKATNTIETITTARIGTSKSVASVGAVEVIAESKGSITADRKSVIKPSRLSRTGTR